MPTVVVGRGSDAVDFGFDRGVFIVQGDALRIGDCAGCRFGGQGYGAVKERGDLRECAVCNLQFADAVGGIAGRLRSGGDVSLQPVGDGQAGRIVGAGIDARA